MNVLNKYRKRYLCYVLNETQYVDQKTKYIEMLNTIINN
jgi:hypothetical protein